VGGVVEVTNVDGPYSDTDYSDHLGELLRELVQFLLQWGPLSFSVHHLITDLTYKYTNTTHCNHDTETHREALELWFLIVARLRLVLKFTVHKL